MNIPVGLARAITAVFIRKLIRKVGVVVCSALLLLLVVFVLLGLKVSGWWLLALAVLIPVTIVTTIVIIALWYVSGRLASKKLAQEETRAVDTFTGKMLSVVERARTPLPILLALLAKDLVLGRETNVVSQTIADSKELHSEYRKLDAIFRA